METRTLGARDHFEQAFPEQVAHRVAMVRAQRSEVVGMVARDGMSIALTGMAIGFISDAGLTRLMRPGDLRGGGHGTACWGTALKAARVDPMVALRTG